MPHIAEAHVAPTNQMRQLSVNDDEDGAVPQGVEGGCPRCGGPVYMAEERVAAGNVRVHSVSLLKGESQLFWPEWAEQFICNRKSAV